MYCKSLEAMRSSDCDKLEKFLCFFYKHVWTVSKIYVFVLSFIARVALGPGFWRQEIIRSYFSLQITKWCNIMGSVLSVILSCQT